MESIQYTYEIKYNGSIANMKQMNRKLVMERNYILSGSKSSLLKFNDVHRSVIQQAGKTRARKTRIHF